MRSATTVRSPLRRRSPGNGVIDLHINDTLDGDAFMNMGIEPFLVTASLNGGGSAPGAAPARVLLHRDHGRGVGRPDERVDVKEGIESETFVFKKGTGCKRCNDTGYKGRVALYEVLEMDDDMRDLVLQGASTAELKEQAIRSGMDTIRRAGLNKLIEGVTSVDEVLRVSGAD